MKHWLISFFLSFDLRPFDDARDDVTSNQHNHRRQTNTTHHADRIPWWIGNRENEKPDGHSCLANKCILTLSYACGFVNVRSYYHFKELEVHDGSVCTITLFQKIQYVSWYQLHAWVIILTILGIDVALRQTMIQFCITTVIYQFFDVFHGDFVISQTQFCCWW